MEGRARARAAPTHPPSLSPSGLAAEAGVEADLDAQLATLRAEAASLPPRLAALQAAARAAADAAARAATAATAGGAAKAARLDAMRTAVAAYERRLGMRFALPVAGEGGTEELRIVFDSLHPAAPAAVATLGVRVRADNSYALVRCEPAAPGVAAALNALNAAGGRDFGGFVRAARAEFRKVVSGGR